MNTTPIQSLIQERADSFYKLFITDDGDYAYTGNDLNATTAPNFLRESILAGIKLGLELGKGCVPDVPKPDEPHDGGDEEYRERVSAIDAAGFGAFRSCRNKTLTALDEKVAEVEKMMV